jgi:hypothetical protein
MKFRKAYLIFFAGVLAVYGCIPKDDFTLPVRIRLMAAVADNPSSEVYLNFTGGIAGIQKIRFTGNREVGGDIFFETDPNAKFEPVSFGLSANPKLISEFDIPQGIYTSADWDIILKGIGATEEDGVSCELDSAYTGLLLTGTYIYLDGSTGYIRIEIDITEQISVKTFDSSGNSSIVLSADKSYEAVMFLVPSFAFHSISRQALEEADNCSEGNQKIIDISSEENDELYQIIVYRLIQSAKIILRQI